MGDYRTSNSERQKRAARFHTNPITQEHDEAFAQAQTGPKKIELKRNTEEFGNDKPDEGKKQVRCRFFPNCSNADCPFVHPTEQCKYFPACTNGPKCIYLHPEIDCKYGVACTRQNCNYKHPKGRGQGRGM